MIHIVKQVRFIKGYELLLTFEDGSTRHVDLAPYLEGDSFEPLKNVNYFKTVQVNADLDTIVWDNGADYAPEFLYEISKPIARSLSAA